MSAVSQLSCKGPCDGFNLWGQVEQARVVAAEEMALGILRCFLRATLRCVALLCVASSGELALVADVHILHSGQSARGR